MKATTLPLRLSALAMVLAIAPSAFAQAWPTKSVRLVAAFPPGTPGDVIARLIQPALQTAWNQPVVIENKTGAGGNLAAGEVAQAKDEHTLLVGPDTILTINPHLYKKLSFNLRTSLKPVTYFASFNQTLACNPSAGITSLAKFVQLPRRGCTPPAAPGHQATWQWRCCWRRPEPSSPMFPTRVPARPRRT